MDRIWGGYSSKAPTRSSFSAAVRGRRAAGPREGGVLDEAEIAAGRLDALTNAFTGVMSADDVHDGVDGGDDLPDRVRATAPSRKRDGTPTPDAASARIPADCRGRDHRGVGDVGEQVPDHAAHAVAGVGGVDVLGPSLNRQPLASNNAVQILCRLSKAASGGIALPAAADADHRLAEVEIQVLQRVAHIGHGDAGGLDAGPVAAHGFEGRLRKCRIGGRRCRGIWARPVTAQIASRSSEVGLARSVQLGWYGISTL